MCRELPFNKILEIYVEKKWQLKKCYKGMSILIKLSRFREHRCTFCLAVKLVGFETSGPELNDQNWILLVIFVWQIW